VIIHIVSLTFSGISSGGIAADVNPGLLELSFMSNWFATVALADVRFIAARIKDKIAAGFSFEKPSCKILITCIL
jgi:hypothetical protein